MSEQVISNSVVINRPRQVVWDYLTTAKNWKKWYDEDDLIEVNPGWQKGATLNFKSGQKPKIEQCEAPGLLHFGRVTIIRLSDKDPSSTEFEWGMVPEGIFAEDPALLAELQQNFTVEVGSMLKRLQNLIESETME